MIGSDGEYSCWRMIHYRPAKPTVNVARLARYLKPGMRVLDIGCNTGGTTLEIARLGCLVEGIDINVLAIERAKQRAMEERVDVLSRFRVGDVVQDQVEETFDVVMAIRLLTCFSKHESRTELLERVFGLVRPNGIVYINDFARADKNPLYCERYAAARAQGLESGSFPVYGENGEVMFVAHHHSDEEIATICCEYEGLELHFYESLSMTGNSCRMFEFIGRRP